MEENEGGRVLEFWFGGLTDDDTLDQEKPPANRWFAGDEAFDRRIRDLFAEDLGRAASGQFRSWENSPRGRLALVLVFDQFSRNMHRGTPAMFATDPQALDLARRSVGDGTDRALMLVERIFLYMPFMHAEDRTIQELSARCFEALVEDSRRQCPHNTPYFSYNLKYARAHRETIARFGRFPHRNAVLGRASTAEELAFLPPPGA